MYNILTLNKIAACGTDIFDKAKYTVSDNAENPTAIMVRSAKMHDMEITTYNLEQKTINKFGQLFLQMK